MKNEHVAIATTSDGLCCSISKVKVISQEELNKYKNQKNEYDARVEEDKKKLLDTIAHLQKGLDQLKEVLAHILGIKEISIENIKNILGVVDNEEN